MVPMKTCEDSIAEGIGLDAAGCIDALAMHVDLIWSATAAPDGADWRAGQVQVFDDAPVLVQRHRAKEELYH